jgi:TRAP-type C4-dicarboxylate transport system substrate-binding protein
MIEEKIDLTRRQFLGRSALFGAALVSLPSIIEACGNSPSSTTSGAARTLTLAHQEPPTGTVLGYHGDVFKEHLEKLSNGNLKINLYPGGTLGDEPVMTKKTLAGDIDFSFSSLTNVAIVAPAAAIAQAHYIYTGETHLLKSLSDSNVNQAFDKLMAESVTSARTLGLYTEGIRNVYSKFAIHSISDVKGKKIRVTASATESAFWSNYGAVPVQISFSQVYTSMQTGLIQMAENNVTAYLAEKHYEPAPIYSATEHEADVYTFWMSMKAWNSLSAQQQGWVEQAANETQPLVNNKAIQLWHDSLSQVQKLGVQYVSPIDKSGFEQAANSIVDPQAQKLGPSAVKFLDAIRKLA